MLFAAACLVVLSISKASNDATSLLPEKQEPAHAPATLAGDVILHSSDHCPKHMKGILFNRGTAYWELIKAVFLEDGGGHKLARDRDKVVKKQLHGAAPQVIYQAGEAGKNKKHSATGEYDNPRYDGKGVIDATRANKYFTLGLVRKPCDMLLSKFGQSNNYKPTKIIDKPAFREFVFARLNSSAELGVSPPMNKVTHSGLMSDMVDARYGKGMVHCMARTHELRGDFEACVRGYQRCGGYVNPNHTYPSYLDEALERSAENAHAGGRSVGDHASCSQMFDAAMVRAVMERESQLVDEFHLGGCC